MTSVSLNSFPDLLKDKRHFVLYQKTMAQGEVKKRPHDWLGGNRGNDSPELQLEFKDALKKLGVRTDLGMAIYQPEGGTQIPYEGGRDCLPSYTRL